MDSPHPPKSVQTCRAQWPRVGNNIDSRDNRFVYVTEWLQRDFSYFAIILPLVFF